VRAAAASTDLSPEAISPLVVWLGSAACRDVTGRVFGVCGNAITVLRGWAEGLAVGGGARWDPAGLSNVIPGLLARADQAATAGPAWTSGFLVGSPDAHGGPGVAPADGPQRTGVRA
jgi:hypothetical protein